MRRFTTALVLLAGLPALGGDGARAATDSTTLIVGAAVTLRCAILVTALDFGPYRLLGPQATTPLDAESEVSIHCGQGRVVRVRMGEGLYPAPGSTAGAPLRRMGMGTARLSYNLYSDAARTQVWSNTAPGIRPPGNNAPSLMPVYGRIPAAQFVPAGLYADTIISTVIF